MEAKNTQNGTTRIGEVELRKLGERDWPALARLAAVDSAPLPSGDWLGAEVGGKLLAAANLADGRIIADPFQRTAELRDLLEMRTAQLAPRRANGHGRGLRLLRRVQWDSSGAMVSPAASSCSQ